jgi:hypothetical protein
MMSPATQPANLVTEREAYLSEARSVSLELPTLFCLNINRRAVECPTQFPAPILCVANR